MLPLHHRSHYALLITVIGFIFLDITHCLDESDTVNVRGFVPCSLVIAMKVMITHSLEIRLQPVFWSQLLKYHTSIATTQWAIFHMRH